MPNNPVRAAAEGMPKIKRASKRRAATPAQRQAMTFEALEIDPHTFDVAWAENHLTTVRVAAVMLNRDDTALQQHMANICREGLAPELLEKLTLTKEQFVSIANMIDIVLNRSFIVLERLGYTPDNPPPDE